MRISKMFIRSLYFSEMGREGNKFHYTGIYQRKQKREGTGKVLMHFFPDPVTAKARYPDSTMVL